MYESARCKRSCAYSHPPQYVYVRLRSCGQEASAPKMSSVQATHTYSHAYICVHGCLHTGFAVFAAVLVVRTTVWEPLALEMTRRGVRDTTGFSCRRTAHSRQHSAPLVKAMSMCCFTRCSPIARARGRVRISRVLMHARATWRALALRELLATVKHMPNWMLCRALTHVRKYRATITSPEMCLLVLIMQQHAWTRVH
jgi:hypothetical protein